MFAAIVLGGYESCIFEHYDQCMIHRFGLKLRGEIILKRLE